MMLYKVIVYQSVCLFDCNWSGPNSPKIKP